MRRLFRMMDKTDPVFHLDIPTPRSLNADRLEAFLNAAYEKIEAMRTPLSDAIDDAIFEKIE
jgi:hypothetical protein